MSCRYFEAIEHEKTALRRRQFHFEYRARTGIDAYRLRTSLIIADGELMTRQRCLILERDREAGEIAGKDRLDCR